MTIIEVRTKHKIETYAACGDGWADLLDRLLTDITALGFKTSQVEQIKEKFGGLRFYYELPLDQRTKAWRNMDAIGKRVREAEQESYLTCEFCGEPGILRDDRYWMQTLCDACAGKRPPLVVIKGELL